MKKYSEIDVPEFMKTKRQPIKTKEEQEQEVEKAFIKGGFAGIISMIILIAMFTILVLIERM